MRKGEKMPLEQREKISAAAIGRPSHRKGTKCSDESRARMSAAQRASEYKRTPESLARQSLRYTGAGNPRWRGGKSINKDGYLYIYQPSHPFATKGCVLEHRLVMEKHIGRYLQPEESVHHRNGNHLDNRIENLVLFATEGQHRAFHAQFRQRDVSGRWKKEGEQLCY